MSLLSDLLTAPDLKDGAIDALQEHLMPLLKHASKEELQAALFHARRLIEKRAAGDDVGAAASKRHIVVLLENVKMEFITSLEDAAGDIALAIVNAATAGLVKAAVGGGVT